MESKNGSDHSEWISNSYVVSSSSPVALSASQLPRSRQWDSLATRWRPRWHFSLAGPKGYGHWIRAVSHAPSERLVWGRRSRVSLLPEKGLFIVTELLMRLARFRPERWEDGSLQESIGWAYLPFNGGPRICLGRACSIFFRVPLSLANEDLCRGVCAFGSFVCSCKGITGFPWPGFAKG